MRALVSASSLLALLAVAAPASAQQVTRMPRAASSAVGLHGGLEAAFVARATYVRRVAVGLLRDERLFARFTMPVVTPDLGDWAIDGGAQATAVSVGELRLALLVGPVVRNAVNEIYSATAIGLGATALLGYEGARWGLSGEVGYEQLFATHLRHSALYRDTAYAQAKDGLYAMSGSTARGGVRFGVRFGAVELVARAGRVATGQLHATTPPFYLTLGGSYAF